MPDPLTGAAVPARTDRNNARAAPGRLALVAAFLLLGGICGLRLVYATPMGQVADEPAHIARAAGLLHFEILGQRVVIGHEPTAGVTINHGLRHASMAELHDGGIPRLTPADRARAASIPWSTAPPVYQVATGSIEYLPLLYIPGALGIAAGRAIGFHPLGALYLGRVFMLAGYLALGALALCIARFGSLLILVLLSLPMTISLAASFNQDGMIIATCALVGALLTHDPARRPAFRWLAAGLFAIVVCSKPPYGLLMFCVALPVMQRQVWRRLVVAALFGIPAIIWVAVMMHASFVPQYLPPYKAGPLWPGAPGRIFNGVDVMANARVLLAHPLQIVILPFRYIVVWFQPLLTEFVGNLGWLDVPVPLWLRNAWLAALLLACCQVPVAQREGARRWTPSDGIFTLLLLLASVIAVCLSLYLSWTNVGATMLQGVQGRYFLPFVPFLPLLIPRPAPPPPGAMARSAVATGLALLLSAPALILSVVDIAILPAMIRHKFW